jgi:YT521-B-like domain-containing protein
MISKVTPNDTTALKAVPINGSDNKESPRTIRTPASEFAPPGLVFEDSFRGTLFWESEIAEVNNGGGKSPIEVETEKNFGGRPFGVAWISTRRVPFPRTRGLYNAWNNNKEVKVARDGTELETSTGNHLIRLFHELS